MKFEKRSAFGWPATSANSAPCKNGLVVHYDGSNQGLAGKSHDSCRAYWKATRKFHMGPARRWRDIGYSYAVCAHGIVMEGRGWQREQAAQPGGNTTWTSVTFMSGDSEKPTDAQVNAFRELRAWLRGKGLAAAISYHGRFISTSCPGKILRGMVTDGKLAGSPSKPSAPAGADAWQEATVKKLPTLGKGDKGEGVETVQGLLLARNHSEVRITGTFDATTEKAVKAVQKWGGVDDDGVVGKNTWPVLLRVH
jgi:hypothetical protein